MKGEGKEGRKMSTFVGQWLQSSWQMDWRQWIPAEWMETNLTKKQSHHRWGDDKRFMEFIFSKRSKKIIKICTSKIQDIFRRLSARQFAPDPCTPATKHEKLFTHILCPGPDYFSLPLGHLLLSSVRIKKIQEKRELKVIVDMWKLTTAKPASAESKLPCPEWKPDYWGLCCFALALKLWML